MYRQRIHVWWWHYNKEYMYGDDITTKNTCMVMTLQQRIHVWWWQYNKEYMYGDDITTKNTCMVMTLQQRIHVWWWHYNKEYMYGDDITTKNTCMVMTLQQSTKELKKNMTKKGGDWLAKWWGFMYFRWLRVSRRSTLVLFQSTYVLGTLKVWKIALSISYLNLHLLLGKGNKQALNNNDEIALALQKNKGEYK